MVVIQEPIEHYDAYGYKNGGDKIISSASVAGKTLQGSAVTSMMGLLVQLSDISKIANNMYKTVLGESEKTHQRIMSLTQRMERTSADLPRCEQQMNSKQQLMVAQPGYGYSAPQVEEQSICSKDNLPPALANQYDKCMSPPNLDELDQHLESIKEPEGDPDDPEVAVQKYLAARPRKCIHLYTDPQYFRLLWAFNEIRRQKQELLDRKKEKEKRREERKQRREKEGAAAEENREKKVVPEMISHRSKIAAKAGDLGAPTPTTTQSKTQEQPQQSTNDIPAPSRPEPAPAPPSHGTVSQQSSQSTAPPPPPDSKPAPPPPPQHQQQSAAPSVPSTAPPPPPPSQPPSQSAQSDMPPPPPPPSTSAPAPPPPPSNNAPAPPPPPPSGAPAPPPPPSSAPAPPSGNDSPAPPPPPPPSSGGGGGGGGGPTSFLDQIRNRQFDLQKAEERQMPEKPVAAPGEEASLSVADILSKKFASVNVSDSEEESDSEDDWSDDEW